MADWELAQNHDSEKLARHHYFSVMKHQDGVGVEFTILVKEYVSGMDQSMRFFAEADKQTNQATAPYTPSGWGSSLLKALSECVQAVNRFPYEPDSAGQ